MPKKKTEESFEDSMKQLEKIVQQMEQGDLSLEESMQQFELGIALSKRCQTTLNEAEQKIKVLLEQHGQEGLFEFDAIDDGE